MMVKGSSLLFVLPRNLHLTFLIAVFSITSACGGSGGRDDGVVNGDENQAPVAITQSLKTTESLTSEITLTGVDSDGDTLSYLVVTEPANGSIQGAPPAVSYLPRNDFIGTDTFTFKVNDGTEDSEVAEISIEVVPALNSELLDALVEETRSRLNSDQPTMSNEEFSQTEYSKNKDSDEEQQRINNAFDLIADAQDPDPEWFATQLSEDIIIGTPGESYTINIDKIDVNGESLGGMDFEKMRLVVSIQTDADAFENVAEDTISTYVEIDDVNGKLKVNTPADLTQGRLLVGLRPNLQDPAQNALAERWSAAITVEIWPLKTNVIPITEADVVFPVESIATGIRANAKFSLAEIKAEVEAALAEENLYLPLVVTGKELGEGQLLDYQVAGFPYGGRIEKVIIKDDQQLILLSPNWKDVYQITDAKDGFLIEQNILPQDVIYRNEEPEFSPSTKKFSGTHAKAKGKSKLFSFFRSNCEGDLLEHNLSFRPSVTVAPFNASLSFSYSLKGNQVSCIWKAEEAKGLEAAANLLLMGSGGPVTIALRKLLGTDIDFKPHGELKLNISSESVVLLGLAANWSLKENPENGKVKNSGNLIFQPANTLNNSTLTGDPVVYSGDGSIGAGIDFALNVLSENGVIGWAFKKLSIDVPDIGIKASANLTESLSANAANPAAVYQKSESSDAAAKIDLEFKVGASDSVVKAIKKLSNTDVNLSLEKKVNLLDGRFKGDYIAEDVEDDFQGNASVGTLRLQNIYLNSLFSKIRENDTRTGKMGPLDINSSIFDENSNKITYKLEECDANGNQITAAVIACEGVFCGKSNAVKLCADPSVPTFGDWEYHLSDSFLDWTDGIACRAGGGSWRSVGWFQAVCDNRDSALTDEGTLLPAASQFFSELGYGGCTLETKELTWPVVLPIWSPHLRLTNFVNGEPVLENDKATSKPSSEPKNNCNNILYDVFFSRNREVICPTDYYLDYIGSEKNYLGYENVENKLATCRRNP